MDKSGFRCPGQETHEASLVWIILCFFRSADCHSEDNQMFFLLLCVYVCVSLLYLLR